MMSQNRGGFTWPSLALSSPKIRFHVSLVFEEVVEAIGIELLGVNQFDALRVRGSLDLLSIFVDGSGKCSVTYSDDLCRFLSVSTCLPVI
jgi:hypothetical protein